MKLNIGCGKQYLPGYTNVDLYENEIADVIASGDDLNFVEDNSVTEITSFHLIEHLGLIDTCKTLSHWATKLKPGGRLVLETPDLESSLEMILKTQGAGEVDWLFGVADLGQTHKRVFFKSELKDILRWIGYTNIRVGEPIGYWKRNTFRLEAKMGVSDFRARVVEQWCNLNLSQGVFRELPINEIGLPLTENKIAKVCVLSPKLAKALLAVHEQIFGAKKNDKIEDWKNIIEHLDDKKLTHYLYSQFYVNSGSNKKATFVFKDVLKAGIDFVTRALKHKHVYLPITIYSKKNIQLKEIFRTYPDLTEFFIEHNVNEISINECALGIKMFSQKKFKLAMEHFENSTRFNWENTISWWNLGRLNWILDDKPGANKAYKTAYKLSKDKKITEEMTRNIPTKQPLELAYGA